MRVFAVIVLFLLSMQSGFAQYFSGSGVYLGIGTTVGSYVGADFGSTFAMRFTNPYPDYYGYNNSYNNGYNSYYNKNELTLSPVEFDLFIGSQLNDFLALEFRSSFIFHFSGAPNRNYKSGYSGNSDYLDYYGNSYLSAIPLMIALKVYPAGKTYTGFYISLGGGYQYTHESVERLREYYDYDYYGYGYGNSVYPLYTLYDNKWFPGISASAGIDVRVTNSSYTNVELKFTNFWTEYDNKSPLAMHTSPNISFVGLAANVYFSFGR